MSGTFLTPLELDADWLNICPYCQGNNLHQADVSIFNGDGYDLEWDEEESKSKSSPRTRVTHVMADNTITTARVPPEATNNPSRDRNGLLLSFSCESCDETPVMAIFQHKGTTFIGWKK